MQLYHYTLDNSVYLVKLEGVLDLVGVEDVERKFKEYSAGEGAWVILDLSGVSFLASIGIRLIVMTAKAIENRGGRLVMLNPIQSVKEILEVTGIGQVIPICEGLDEARAALTA